MASDNAFALNEATGVSNPDESRQRKLKSLGSLRGLFNEPASQEDELAPQAGQPLYGGEISKDTGTAENEPSALATERIQRAPLTQEASPLLGPDERLGNIATGEEGQYGPLTGEQRSVSLRDFFGPLRGEEPGQPSEGGGGPISRDVGGASGASQNAALAINAAKLANKPATSLAKSLAALFATPGETIRAPAGIFNNVSPLGPVSSEIGQGLETITAPQGIFNGVAPSGPVSSEAGAALGGASNLIGPIGAGVGGLLSIASLLNSLFSGSVDTSKTGVVPNTIMNAGISTLPLIQSLIGPAAGAGLGLSGIGLAATPMLIPAIEGLINLFKEPNFPEVAGHKTHGLSDYKSALMGQALAPEIQKWINENADNPSALLSLAQHPNVNPTGEITYQGMPLDQLNDQTLPQFISQAGFSSGSTGNNFANSQLTDTYKRTLAHALGVSPEQAPSLFGPDEYGGFQQLLNQMIAGPGTVGNVVADPMNYGGSLDVGGLQSLYNSIPGFAAPEYQNFGGYSPYYRDPAAGRLSPDQVPFYQSLIQNYINSLSPQPTPYSSQE